MPKLVQKCGYIRNGSAAKYMQYIATREGVEKLHGRGPVTQPQKELIERLLKDYPDTKELFEYSDYCASPTFGNASELITMALDANVHTMEAGDGYLKYIATRPRVEKRGDHGLFSTSNFGMRMVSEVIPWFKRKYPGYTIEITEVSVPALLAMIQEEQLDLGLTAMCELKKMEAKVEILRREEVLLAVSRENDLARRPEEQPMSWEEFDEKCGEMTFVLGKQGSTLRDLADQVFQAAGREPDVCCESNNVVNLRNMVAHNAAASFLAESCALDPEHIAYYRMQPGLYRLNVMVTRKNWNQTPAEAEFSDALRNYFRNNREAPFLAEKL